MEGQDCFEDGCDTAGLVLPQHEYSHEDGCSITGGYVYRGSAIPEIAGHYFFGDYCSQKVWSFRYADGQATDLTDWTAQLGGQGEISSFGLDSAGELYITTLNGRLFKVVKG
jgi:hypothetical protein